MIRRPPRSTQSRSSAASDVYKRQDINNLAYALMVRGAVFEVWLPAARGLVADVVALAREHASQPMLAHTHGQPAVSYTHLRAHETRHDLVCRLLLEKKKTNM